MTLGQLIASLGLDTTSIDMATQTMKNFESSANKSINSVQKNLDTISRDFKRFGMAATAGLTVPLSIAGAASFKMAKDFEASMQTVVGLVGISQKQVDSWGSEILALAPSLGRAPKELADALYFVTSSGFKSAEAMDIMKVSAKAASAGLGETIKIADLATSAMNAYKDSGLSAANVTDVLTAAVREGKGEASQFAMEMGEVIPVAANMGVSFDQVAAAMSAMTLTGSTVEETATYMRQILVSLLDATPKAEEALKKMGISSAFMRKEIREKGLLSALSTLNDLTKKYGESTMGQVFGNIRALTGVLSLMGDRLEENKTLFDVVKNSTGDMDKAFQVAADTINFKYNAALSQVKVSAIELGLSFKDAVIPVLEWFANTLKSIIAWYKDLSDANQRLVVYLAAVLALVGPLALAISGLTTAFKYLTIVMSANPFVILATAIGIGVVALTAFLNRTKDTVTIQRQYNSSLNTQETLMKAANKSIDDRIKKLKELNKAQLIALKTDLESQMVMARNIIDPPEKKLLKAWDAARQEMQKSGKQFTLEELLSFTPDAEQKADATFKNVLGYVKNFSAESKKAVSDAQKTYDDLVQKLATVNNAIDNFKKPVTDPAGLSSEDEIATKLTQSLVSLNNQQRLMGDSFDINEGLLKAYTKALEDYAEANITTGENVEFAKGKFAELSEFFAKKDDLKKVEKLVDFSKELQKELAWVAYENSVLKSSWDYTKQQQQFDLLAAKLQVYRQEMQRLFELQQTNKDKGIFDVTTETQLASVTGQVVELQKQLGILEAQQYVVDNLGWAFGELGNAIGGTTGEWLNFASRMIDTVPKAIAFLEAISVATGMQTAKTTAQAAAESAQTATTIAASTAQSAAVATTTAQTVATIALAKALTATAVAGAMASAAWIPFPFNLAAMETAAATLLATLTATTVAAQTAITAGIGAPGLANGGVIPPGYPNDTYPAWLSSGEVVTPPGKLTSSMLGQSAINLTGKFRIEGRDLVYVLEKENTLTDNI